MITEKNFRKIQIIDKNMRSFFLKAENIIKHFVNEYKNIYNYLELIFRSDVANFSI